MDQVQMYRWPGENDLYHIPRQYTLDDIDFESDDVPDVLDIDRRTNIERGTSLGDLQELPVEVLTMILPHMDIPTLMAFRQINTEARDMVDFLQQYRTIVTHCPNVLRALASTRATSFTLDSLYRTLFTEECSRPNCRLFGAYLNLITASRFCFEHFPERLAVPGSRVLEMTDITMEQLEKLPHMYSLPGLYSPIMLRYNERDILVDRENFVEWARLDPDAMDRMFPVLMDRDVWDRIMALPYMAVISAPFLSGSGPTADWGVGCAVCERSWYGWICTISGGTYTQRGLLEHFQLNGLPADDGEGGEFHSRCLPSGNLGDN